MTSRKSSMASGAESGGGPSVERFDVVVIGGGMAGLAAADAPLRPGPERTGSGSGTVGGRSVANLQRRGRAIEAYYHHVFPQDRETCATSSLGWDLARRGMAAGIDGDLMRAGSIASTAPRPSAVSPAFACRACGWASRRRRASGTERRLDRSPVGGSRPLVRGTRLSPALAAAPRGQVRRPAPASRWPGWPAGSASGPARSGVTATGSGIQRGVGVLAASVARLGRREGFASLRGARRGRGA